jgi:ubiquitin fusion degradation protein 1
MIFKITNDRTGVSSHCGVLEFSAKEGVSYIPGWVKKSIFVL